ncbi:MAG TPA: hypothetical protein VET48_10650 [Steroidobacteraceae bacterium]|nr:hypothetical protein [Steroidobacteraceae bacterium]
MTHSRPAIRTRRRVSPARLAITLFALLAFALQNYVTQTHIHLTHAMAVKLGVPAEHEKYPSKEDPSNCPICQEIMHAGAFVTPSAVPLLLPSFTVSIIALVIEAPVAIRALSHSWQGRAPPHA